MGKYAQLVLGSVCDSAVSFFEQTVCDKVHGIFNLNDWCDYCLCENDCESNHKYCSRHNYCNYYDNIDCFGSLCIIVSCGNCFFEFGCKVFQNARNFREVRLIFVQIYRIRFLIALIGEFCACFYYSITNRSCVVHDSVDIFDFI